MAACVLARMDLACAESKSYSREFQNQITQSTS
jgi:hypothetical protein